MNTGFWSDALGIYVPDPNHKSTKTYWFRVAASWLDGDKLLPQRWYGEDWPWPRERSKYLVENLEVRVVTDDSWRNEKYLYVASSSRIVRGTAQTF